MSITGWAPIHKSVLCQSNNEKQLKLKLLIELKAKLNRTGKSSAS